MKKRLMYLSLILAMTISQVFTVSASKEEIQAQKAETTSRLEQAQTAIGDLENQLTVLQSQISEANSELVDTMVQIQILNDEIASKEAEITTTQQNLEAAVADKEQQYSDMKTRIRYLYENGGNAAWAQMILEAKDITSLLNKAEYTQKLYEYDRTKLEQFAAIVQQVTELENELLAEKSELEEMKKNSEVQQASLEQLIQEKQATSSDYSEQLAVVEQQANEYRELIAQQNEQIRAIEEEEARQAAAAAAAEAARQAAAAAAAEEANRQQQAASSQDSVSNSSSSGTSVTEQPASGGSSNSTITTPSAPSNSGGTSSGGSSSSGTVSSSSVGQAAADYACQFVGNPYVWGGTSLTNGADCSGFIMSVYAHFGYSLPHSSASMRSVGTGVSYSQAQPGDIICYSGHVAIYIGGGAIVHASNEAEGIKISPNAAYREILAVRRIG